MPTDLHDRTINSQDPGQSIGAAVSTERGQIGGERQLQPAIKQTGGTVAWIAPRLRTTIEALLFVPLAVLVLEIFFNLAGIGQSELIMPDLTLGSKHIAGKLITWHLEGYSHDRISSAGLRDIEHAVAKPPGVKRIAFLGDSYTEGLQVSLPDTFARRMESRLNAGNKQYESINFGCSGYSTGQELIQFNQEAARYKPDLVVLLYTPGDTLENSVSPLKRSDAEPRPYFYLGHQNKLCQDNGVLTLNYEKLRPRPLREFLRAHSTIFGAYAQTNLSLKMSDKLYFRLTRFLGQVSGKIAAIVSGSNKNQAPPAGLIPPNWREPDKLAVSEALIKKLNHDVTSAGGKLVVMAYPDVGKGDPQYIKARGHLAALARSEGYGYLDLSDAFSHDQNPNSLFIKVHFSKLGHDLTAGQLTAYLKEAGFVPH